jgi:hypothetical protein
MSVFDYVHDIEHFIFGFWVIPGKQFQHRTLPPLRKVRDPVQQVRNDRTVDDHT